MLFDSFSKSWEKVGKASPEAEYHIGVAAEVMASV
jgi:hypothetical protein